MCYSVVYKVFRKTIRGNSVSYLDNLDITCITANNLAFKYGDWVAWDNVKNKMIQRYFPRGQVVQRLEKLEWDKCCTTLLEEWARKEGRGCKL